MTALANGATRPAPVTEAVSCELIGAGEPAQLAAHYAIRRAVFVTEQRVFPDTDRDAHDAERTTLRAIGLVDGVPAGTVRLFPLDPGDPTGTWQGDRLAVLPAYRTTGLGAVLVRFAVATAGGRGGRAMIAHIQPANRTFFRRLGWTQRGEPELYVGRPHFLMEIRLGPAAT
jgi:putative N-acetyltransferase (TIGR04045 family)